MIITAYGKEIHFTDEEEKIFKDNAINLKDGFMELLLYWIDVENFDNIETKEDLHNICIDAIMHYSEAVKNTLINMEEDKIL